MIRFFDTTGSDLSEDAQRKVERLFGREDFRRVFPAEIGDIGFPPRALEQYTAALEATVDISAIRAARFKVVVDYAYGSTSFVMPNVLAKLEAGRDATGGIAAGLDDLPLFAAAAEPEHERDELLAALGEIEPDSLSPREALEHLYRLKRLAAERDA